MSVADPEETVIVGIAQGDDAALQALMARKQGRIAALSRRMLGDPVEAEDVVQEVFLRAWRQARVWKPGTGRFDTWMHRVALNLCYDRLRRRREAFMAEPPEQPDPTPLAEACLMSRDRATQVAAAVAALPRRQREALLLCHYQELSNVETAQAMCVSVEAVESLLSRGRRALRLSLVELRP